VAVKTPRKMYPEVNIASSVFLGLIGLLPENIVEIAQ
jgi:hypothetical protein